MPHTLFTTDFGTCALSWGEEGLTGFQLPDETDAKTRARISAKDGADEAAGTVPAWVGEVIRKVRLHLSGKPQDFTGTPIAWRQVSGFQKSVYVEARGIGAGEIRSYGDISAALSLGPEGARAVGAALGSNPWPLIVPCHRVVSADGKMTGFSAPGGVRTKTRLLVLEGAELLSE